jgi:hypothetical protein
MSGSRRFAMDRTTSGRANVRVHAVPASAAPLTRRGKMDFEEFSLRRRAEHAGCLLTPAAFLR